MNLCERKKSFIKFPTLILHLKLQTSVFSWFSILTGWLTGWVGLELSVILTQAVGRFDVKMTPYTGIYTNNGKAEIIYFWRPKY